MICNAIKLRNIIVFIHIINANTPLHCRIAKAVGRVSMVLALEKEELSGKTAHPQNPVCGKNRITGLIHPIEKRGKSSLNFEIIDVSGLRKLSQVELTFKTCGRYFFL